jgi:hypothetical protein
MIRPSPAKIQEQTQLQADVEAFLARGGQVEELPGFGMAPKITHVAGQRFTLNSDGRVNTLTPEVNQGIYDDLKAGLSSSEIVRKWQVGSSSVLKRKEHLIARGELNAN